MSLLARSLWNLSQRTEQDLPPLLGQSRNVRAPHPVLLWPTMTFFPMGYVRRCYYCNVYNIYTKLELKPRKQKLGGCLRKIGKRGRVSQCLPCLFVESTASLYAHVTTLMSTISQPSLVSCGSRLDFLVQICSSEHRGQGLGGSSLPNSASQFQNE